MDFQENIEKYLNNENRDYSCDESGLRVKYSFGDLATDLTFEFRDGSLFMITKLPIEVNPLGTEEVLKGVNSANAYANFGGFSLSPSDQTISFKCYVRLRGDVDGEIAFLFKNGERTLEKFAYYLCQICVGKLTSDKLMEMIGKDVREP